MCLPRQYMHAGLAPDEHYLAKPDSGLSTDHMCSQTVETNVYTGFLRAVLPEVVL